MSQQPPQGRPDKRPVPDRATGQQAMEAKSQQAAQQEDDEEDEESVMDVWLRQSPSWLSSMVFHMILFLVLMLIPLGGETTDTLKELTIGDPQAVEDEELEEEVDEPLNEDQPEIESENEEQVEEVVSPVEMQVETPELNIDTQQEVTTLASAQVDFSEFATETVMSADVLRDLEDLSKESLGSRTSRTAAVRKGGGTKGSELAVEAALQWLARHQNRNGSWSWNHTPGDRCSGFANPGEKKTKMGATGLALLPFLGAGYTHTDGNYKKTVRMGLKYLIGNMQVANNAGRLYDANGPGHEHMYSHGIAACALAEAYGMTQDPKLKAPSQLALNYIVQAQHPQNGGWLYTPRAGGDTSVVGWQIMALKSGILSHLQVPGRVKTGANLWLDFVQSEFAESDGGIGSRYGYRVAGDRDRPGQSYATTAIGLLCRNYLGAKKDDPGLRKGIEWIASRGPNKNDMYANYYATMLMYQNDGPDGELWNKWNDVMRDQLINTQVTKGRDAGSWHFADHHGNLAGRVYSTALAAMTLEVYYRYLPVYKQENVQQDDFPLE